jgi:hypothetical protein
VEVAALPAVFADPEEEAAKEEVRGACMHRPLETVY